MMGRRILACLACFVVIAGVASAASKDYPQNVQNILHGDVADPTSKTFQAAYWYVVCDAEVIVDAANTDDVSNAIKQLNAKAKAEGKKLKIRATRNKFHSSAIFTCPNPNQETALGTDVPSEGFLAVGILHDKMKAVIATDPEKHTMRVGAGMNLTDLINAADAAKMSVQNGALTAYQGLTLAGIFTTSAHGSGDLTVGMLADMVIDFTWVDATGKVHVSTRDSAEGRMMSGGLGLLGVITEFTLQMTPPSLTRLNTWYMRDDRNLMNDITTMLKEAPHILIFWRPDMRQYSAYLIKKAEPGAIMTNPDAEMTVLPSFTGQPNYVGFMADWQSDLASRGLTRHAMCPASYVNSVMKTWASTRFGFPLLRAVAPTNHMQSADCKDGCAWTAGNLDGTAQDQHFSIEHDRLGEWIGDVQRIFKVDMQSNGTRPADCLGPGYIWIRFGNGTSDYLSMQGGLKRPAYLQSTWLRSRKAFDYPIKHGHVLDLIEELSLCKYQARPHWGKNFERTFTHPKCPLRPMFPKFNDALAMQTKYDPKKVFEPALFTKVRKQEAYKYSSGCALRGECYCTEDVHCGAGMKCVPSMAFPEYKICHFSGNFNW